MRTRWILAMLVGANLLGAAYSPAQQKPQWLPGQQGLNAGVMPSDGITYINMDVNYNAGSFNGPQGSSVPATGTYNVWAIENIFYFVPKMKVLHGTLGSMIMFPTPATGSLVADISTPIAGIPNLNAAGGGSGLADLWLQPVTLGWHLKRADIYVGDGLLIPTGRYSAGAKDNVGSGYFGNHLESGTTYYITKNKGTSANLFTDWEAHGSRQGVNNTSKTPGQAFSDEWGLGQVLPIKKDLTQLLQIGVVGYDQWQITDNGGTTPLAGIPVRASILPHYSVHAVGGQLNYILPLKNFSAFFKYEHEYSSSSHTLGNTLVFGGSYTWKLPKRTQPKT